MRILFLGLSLLFLSHCKSTRSSQLLESVAGPSVSPQEIQNMPAWNAYVSEVEARYPLQPACRPASFEHRGAQQQGLVILFHGFTACPQQFFAIGKRLAEAGFDVLIPLNPGHGMRTDTGVKEQASLPNKENYREASNQFISTINGIARMYAAPVKVVAGLSLGGTYAAAAVAEDATLYQRAIIMTPFLRLNGLIANIVGGVNNIDELTRSINPDATGTLTQRILSQTIGWGDGCRQETQAGRQGICNFDFTHLVGAQQFGWELSRDRQIQGRLQFILVEGDTAVDNNRIKWYYENKIIAFNSTKSLCFYPKPANHSLASRFDRPEEDKFWLKAFEEDLIRYVVEGTFWGHASGQIDGYPKCRI